MNEFFDRVHEGLPINDIEIIDFHAHLGPYYNMNIPQPDSDSMVHVMDLAEAVNRRCIFQMEHFFKKYFSID